MSPSKKAIRKLIRNIVRPTKKKKKGLFKIIKKLRKKYRKAQKFLVKNNKQLFNHPNYQKKLKINKNQLQYQKSKILLTIKIAIKNFQNKLRIFKKIYMST